MFTSYSEKVFRPNLKSQLLQINEVQWFSCDICDKEEGTESHWRSETDVELHRKESHFPYISRQLRDNRDRFCTVCMKLQESKSALISHIKQSHLLSSPNALRVEREIFICDYCKHIFFNKDVLEAHIQFMHLWSHEERRGRTFVCPKCQKIRQLRSLWFHMQNHDIPSVSICDICLTHCANTIDLKLHVKDHPMFFKCEICSFQTLKDGIFEKHLQGHKSAPIKKDMLTLKNVLADVFIKPSNPNFHVKYNIHHSIRGLIAPPLVYICTLCREICTEKNEMLEHMARDHVCEPAPAQAPAFRCQCGQAFVSRVLLKHHVFKAQGAHREVAAHADNQPTISQKIRPPDVTVLKKTVQTDNKTNTIIESNEPKETSEKNNAVDKDGSDELKDGALEMDVGESREPIEIEMAQEGDENSGEELVYIYTTIDDDDLVTVEQDNDEVVGF